MPRNTNQIQFGKVVITGDNTLKELEAALDRIIKNHGYPEEKKTASEEDIKHMEELLKQQDGQGQQEQKQGFIKSIG